MLIYSNSLHKPLSLGWGGWLVEWRCLGTGWQHCYEVHQEVVGWNSWSCIPGKLCLFYSKMATETADHAFQVYSICFIQRWQLEQLIMRSRYTPFVLFKDVGRKSWWCIPGILYMLCSKIAIGMNSRYTPFDLFKIAIGTADHTIQVCSVLFKDGG